MAKNKSPSFVSYIEENVPDECRPHSVIGTPPSRIRETSMSPNDVSDGNCFGNVGASQPHVTYNASNILRVGQPNDLAYNRASDVSSISNTSKMSSGSSEIDSPLSYRSNEISVPLHPSLLTGDKILVGIECVAKYIHPKVPGHDTVLGHIYCTKFKVQFVPISSEDPNFYRNKLFGEHDIPLSSIHSIYQVSKTKKRKLGPTLINNGIHKKVKKLEIQCKNFRTHNFWFLPHINPTKTAELVARIIQYTYPNSKDALFAIAFRNYVPPSDNLSESRDSPVSSMESDSMNFPNGLPKSSIEASKDEGHPSDTVPELDEERNFLPVQNFKNLKFEKGDDIVMTHPSYRSVSDWQKEMSRLNVQGFNILDFNRDYTFMSMPCCFACPANLSVDDIIHAFRYSDITQPPTWCYTHTNGASIVRMASEKGPLTKIGRQMLQAVNTTNGSHGFPVIIDTGKVPSIPTIQSSFEKLREVCVPVGKNELIITDRRWFSNLEKTNWLEVVSQTLKKAVYTCQQMINRRNVVLQEEYGHDMNAVISCLVQIMMDPHCRTIQGFENLVQRQWTAMGHRFTDRYGLLANRDYESPVFLLFLDCVWQISEQFPSTFEFTQTYLVTLWDSLCVGFFDTFLFNSEFERTNHPNTPPCLMTSVWNWGCQFEPDYLVLFRNPLYLAAVELSKDINTRPRQTGSNRILLQQDVVLPDNSAPMIQLWAFCYLRWQASTEIVGGGTPMEYLHQSLLVDDIMRLRKQTEELEIEVNDVCQVSENGSAAPLNPTTDKLLSYSHCLTSSFPFSIQSQPYNSGGNVQNSNASLNHDDESDYDDD